MSINHTLSNCPSYHVSLIIIIIILIIIATLIIIKPYTVQLSIFQVSPIIIIATVIIDIII